MCYTTLWLVSRTNRDHGVSFGYGTISEMFRAHETAGATFRILCHNSPGNMRQFPSARFLFSGLNKSVFDNWLPAISRGCREALFFTPSPLQWFPCFVSLRIIWRICIVIQIFHNTEVISSRDPRPSRLSNQTSLYFLNSSYPLLERCDIQP